ncbi:GspE/PulE family protein [Aeromonas salmonicida]|uniref:GspE/PulE family protein n=1 Tax=Aeromonas salmonicida TaxID=645 RepID=UPI000B3F6ADA|nr:ATPase, T2SS/T4P/T4SS family [Aeromonas salmonicida]ARW85321.1 hypothetical protein O23A_P3p0022 [Aeromonas salmonicida]
MKILKDEDGRKLADEFGLDYLSLEDFERYYPDDLKAKSADAAALSRRTMGITALSNANDIVIAVCDFSDGANTAAVKISNLLKDDGYSSSIVVVTESTFISLSQRVFNNLSENVDDTSIAENENHLRLLLGDSKERRASDIRIALLQDSTMIQYEIDGRLEASKFSDSPRSFGVMLGRCIFSHLPSKEGGVNTSTGEYNDVEQLNATFTLAGGRWRAGLFPADIGPVISIRSFGVQGPLPSLEELGFEPEQCIVIRQSTHLGNGAFVVTGPTGSGKSTTLAAIADELNDGSRAIYSLEDPVERYIDGIYQATVEDIEDADKTRTFKQMGKQLLRQKPNVIIYGEIRTQSTAESAIRMGTTGHMCLGTLHTASAMGAAVSLAYDLGIDANRLRDPSLLRAIVYQRLVSKVCACCGYDWEIKQERISSYHAKRIKEFFDEETLGKMRFIGDGCNECGGRGFKGRTVVAEVVPIDNAALQYIAVLDTVSWHQHLFQDGRWDTIQAHAIKKIQRGIVDIFECEKQLGILTGLGVFDKFDPDEIKAQVLSDAKEKDKTLKST